MHIFRIGTAPDPIQQQKKNDKNQLRVRNCRQKKFFKNYRKKIKFLFYKERLSKCIL